MTYFISTKSGSATFSVTDNTVNTDLDVNLVGKGYVSYGNALNTNFVRLLENFADTAGNQPTKSTEGQLWYNKTASQLLVYNGTDYIRVTPLDTAFPSLQIGNMSYAATSITGQLTNTNISVLSNGTGTVNINRLAIQNTTAGRMLFTAANGMVSTNSAQYNPTSDTLTLTSLSATNLAGTLTTAAQTQITSVGTLTSLNVSGNVAVGNIKATGTGGQVEGYHTGPIGANVPNAGIFTSVMTTNAGNIYGYHNGAIGANTANTGAFTTLSASTITASSFQGVVGNVTPAAGTFTTLSCSLGLAASGISTVGTNYVTNPSSIDGGRIFGLYNQSYMPGASFSISDMRIIDFGVTTGNIAYLRHEGSNGLRIFAGGTGVSFNNTLLPTSNASINIGSTTAHWNNIYAVTFAGTSTTAKYADLAENYTADSKYEPATVVEFGGINEITIAEKNSKRVAGIVSTNPAYLMNSDQIGDLVVAVALQGRVPCKVLGPVEKGDMLVSAGNGYAEVNNDPQVGTVVGKSLEKFDGVNGIIEVVVGRS